MTDHMATFTARELESVAERPERGGTGSSRNLHCTEEANACGQREILEMVRLWHFRYAAEDAIFQKNQAQATIFFSRKYFKNDNIFYKVYHLLLILPAYWPASLELYTYGGERPGSSVNHLPNIFPHPPTNYSGRSESRPHSVRMEHVVTLHQGVFLLTPNAPCHQFWRYADTRPMQVERGREPSPWWAAVPFSTVQWGSLLSADWLLGPESCL